MVSCSVFLFDGIVELSTAGGDLIFSGSPCAVRPSLHCTPLHLKPCQTLFACLLAVAIANLVAGATSCGEAFKCRH